MTKMQISHTHVWSCQIVNISVNMEARLTSSSDSRPDAMQAQASACDLSP